MTTNSRDKKETEQPEPETMNGSAKVNDDAEQAVNDEAEGQESDDAPEQGDDLKYAVAEAKDKYLRLYSEFENYRRRTSKERIDLIKNATEDLVAKLLPVLDDFERARKALPQDEGNEALQGIDLIYNKFKSTLTSTGLKEMQDLEEAEFNPEFHEAIAQIPAPDAALKGKIVDVTEKGYFLNDKVIRFAKVVIGA
jgi:molecular chaperone GrpE